MTKHCSISLYVVSRATVEHLAKVDVASSTERAEVARPAGRCAAVWHSLRQPLLSLHL